MRTAASWRWLVSLLACSLACVVCYVWIDRPVAAACRPFLDTRLGGLIGTLMEGLGILFAVLVLSLLGFGFVAMKRRPLGTAANIVILCTWAVVLGFAAETVLKALFGRISPLMYLSQNVYGFELLRGMRPDNSFPSGTATLTIAAATVLAAKMPRMRVVPFACAALLCVAVIVLDGHWISDVIAGVYLGVVVGHATMALISVNDERSEHPTIIGLKAPTEPSQ